MKKVTLNSIVTIALVLLTTGCGGGSAGADGINSLVVQSIEVNGSNCTYGGIRIDSGMDSNSDGNLSSDEITQTSYVCNGSSGVDGTSGIDGANGIDGISGVDGTDGVDGKDGSDGVDGTNGANGLNALVLQSVEANGSNCSSGGIKIDTGIDSDGDGNLSISEIAQTSYVCNGSDYTPVVTDSSPVITVLGDNPATVSHGTSYADAGAIAYDANDGFIIATSTGSVDTMTIGSYTITYSASDSDGNEINATRTVNVIDATTPVISLYGFNPTTLNQGETYTDEGATAMDSVDGVVSVSVDSSGVDTTMAGTYSVILSATDTSGNEANATRTVIVANVTPTATDLNETVPYESTGYAITLLGIDAGSDTLTYTVVSNPTHGTLTGSGANLTYTPDSGYSGDDSFTYKVNDGTEDSNTATVSLSVEYINFSFTTQEQNESTLTTPELLASYLGKRGIEGIIDLTISLDGQTLYLIDLTDILKTTEINQTRSQSQQKLPSPAKFHQRFLTLSLVEGYFE